MKLKNIDNKQNKLYIKETLQITTKVIFTVIIKE